MESNSYKKINEDFLTAYKAHDELKVSVLRLVKSALKNAEIALRQNSGPSVKEEPLSDEDVILVLKREAKQRRESIEAYNAGKQTEMAEKEESELKIISSYLPEELSKEEVEKIVETKISSLGATNQSQIGQIIGAIMSENKGKIDGSLVSQIVRERLK